LLVNGERRWRNAPQGGEDCTALGREENERRDEEAPENGRVPGKGKGCDKEIKKGCDKDGNQMAHKGSLAKQPRVHAFSRRSPSERAKAFKPTWLIPEATEDA
jgi:hypothetical protein